MNKAHGQCLCNAISFTAEYKEEKFSACHCDMCRRWGSGPYLAMPATLTEIEGEEHIKSYKSSEWAERAFCNNCGTNLYYKVTAEGQYQGATYISFGLLDDHSGLVLDKEIFIDEKPGGYNFAGDHMRQTAEEVMAEFSGGEDGEVSSL